MSNNNERRQFARIYRNFILSHAVKGSQEEFEVSQINDISRGGINFVATRSITIGAELSIQLKTPFLPETIYVEGRVLDVKEKIADLIYDVRVQFTAVSPISAEVLQKIEDYAAKEM